MLTDIKLVRILKTFQTADWRLLEKFIRSPWFVGKTDQKRLLGMLQVLKKVHPNYESLEEGTLSVAAFGVEQKKGQLSKLTSKLIKAIDQYLIQANQPPAEVQDFCLLAQSWEDRGESKLAQQKLEKAERAFTERSDRQLEYFNDGRLLAEARIKAQATQSPAEITHYLYQQEDYLDAWYLLAKLEQAVWKEAQRIQTKTPRQHVRLSMENLQDAIDALDKDDYPVHVLYRTAWYFLRDYPKTALQSYYQLQQAIQRYGHLIASEKRKALQTLLRIFTTSNYNQGKRDYLELALQLYQQDLDAGDLYFDGKIHSQTLLNLVVLGLRSGAFDWVEHFLNAHEDKVWEEVHALPIIRLNRALLAFYRGELAEALDYLDDYYENLYYRLTARRLEIMIYYEEQSVLLAPKLEAFKVYLFRLSKKEIPDKPKAMNNNFIDLLRQIIHPSTLGNEKRIQRLLKKIVVTERLAEREWLTAKLEALLP